MKLTGSCTFFRKISRLRGKDESSIHGEIVPKRAGYEVHCSDRRTCHPSLLICISTKMSWVMYPRIPDFPLRIFNMLAALERPVVPAISSPDRHQGVQGGSPASRESAEGGGDTPPSAGGTGNYAPYRPRLGAKPPYNAPPKQNCPKLLTPPLLSGII